jgi:hypothetical protein
VEQTASRGHRLISDPQLGDKGLPLASDQTTIIRYALGAIPAPQRWTSIRDISLGASEITLTDVSGDTRAIPFWAEHFKGLV